MSTLLIRRRRPIGRSDVIDHPFKEIVLPGDVILTGTPAGIGPMIAGGSATMSIEGLGDLTNKVSKN